MAPRSATPGDEVGDRASSATSSAVRDRPSPARVAARAPRSVHPPRPERHRPAGPPGRERSRPRCPRTRRRRAPDGALLSYFPIAHPPANEIGRAAKPRTLTECTRAARRRSRSRSTRRSTSSSATRASSRASLPPRQKCGPAEGQHVAGCPRRYVVAVRLGEDALVAIGRPDQEHDAIRPAWLPCSSTSPTTCAPAPASSRRSAASPRPRAGPGPDRRRSRRPLLGVADEPVDRVAEELGGGLVAGDDHEEEEARISSSRDGRRRSRRRAARR